MGGITLHERCTLLNETERYQLPCRGYGDEYDYRKIPLEIKIVNNDNDSQNYRNHVDNMMRDIANQSQRIQRLEKLIDSMTTKLYNDKTPLV